mmetsp:Transcript_27207/g.71625  ORF Transcript_27207/g.71625 Transcript_27207/m.71625 type:complete len:269 (+) Transcript_27207:889-1695(+)
MLDEGPLRVVLAHISRKLPVRAVQLCAWRVEHPLIVVAIHSIVSRVPDDHNFGLGDLHLGPVRSREPLELQPRRLLLEHGLDASPPIWPSIKIQNQSAQILQLLGCWPIDLLLRALVLRLLFLALALLFVSVVRHFPKLANKEITRFTSPSPGGQAVPQSPLLSHVDPSSCSLGPHSRSARGRHDTTFDCLAAGIDDAAVTGNPINGRARGLLRLESLGARLLQTLVSDTAKFRLHPVVRSVRPLEGRHAKTQRPTVRCSDRRALYLL